MKKIALLIALQAATFGAIAETNITGYAVDSGGSIARNSYGGCWRNSFWRAEDAVPECEGGAAKAATPAPTPAPTPVAAPAPVVAPVVVAAPVARAVAPVPAPAVAAPAPKPAAKVEKKLALEANTAFAVGKADLTAEGKATVDKEVMTKLNGFSTIERVTIEGHADPMGKEATNRSLSKNRAEAVKSYMVSKGVKADIISTEGKGSSEPKAGVTCDAKLPKAKLSACYAPHRRIEIDVKGEAK